MEQSMKFAGVGGASLSDLSSIKTKWSIYQDHDFGFVKLPAFYLFNLLRELLLAPSFSLTLLLHSTLQKSSYGKVYDSFTISRDYSDILACTVDSCPAMTLASRCVQCGILVLQHCHHQIPLRRPENCCYEGTVAFFFIYILLMHVLCPNSNYRVVQKLNLISCNLFRKGKSFVYLLLE